MLKRTPVKKSASHRRGLKHGPELNQVIDADKKRRILIFSAHAADFCSRTGGTIALYVSGGVQVHVVALTFGERGESEDYWRTAGRKSTAEAKRVRAREAREAAGILGATIEFLDYDDYPLIVERDRLEAIARLVRTYRPGVILTHWKIDPYNVDHEVTTASVIRAA